MKVNKPYVSVVIPAYNQAQFLTDALQSVLAQTYGNYEIIVVDDGSTDNTSTVAKQFGDNIRYIYQENRGLAGARNTGIRHAKGQYIALLDSDDMWLPSFLERMMKLAQQNPDGAVFFCGARYMDADGNNLPQSVHMKLNLAHSMYETLAQANFLIPSTIVMQKSVVVEAGLFDQSLRSCEDWDLWLRLAPEHNFVGIADNLVRYRVHGSSLSTDPSGMQGAAKAVIEKHFGPDDGKWQHWSQEKRKAYGGLYSYHAWTSVLRQNDWDKCAQYIRQALLADPTIAENPDIFYELALGTQPPGYRGISSEHLALETNAKNLEKTLANVFAKNTDLELLSLRQRTYGTAYYAVGLLAYHNFLLRLARSYLWRALITWPQLGKQRQMWITLTKSMLGSRLLARCQRIIA